MLFHVFSVSKNPIPSMHGIFTYIWLIFMVNVGKYAIHGWYGNRNAKLPVKQQRSSRSVWRVRISSSRWVMRWPRMNPSPPIPTWAALARRVVKPTKMPVSKLRGGLESGLEMGKMMQTTIHGRDMLIWYVYWISCRLGVGEGGGFSTIQRGRLKGWTMIL